jgi:cytochrome oxidase Cu insertion factor (SCO1/SenC/PrrC family)
MPATRREAAALGGLAAVLAVSVGWWAAALWPLPQEVPEWVVRARAACFGQTESGLPDAGGWVLLLGSPPVMLAALALMSGGALGAGLRRLSGSWPGRAAITGCASGLALLAGAAFVRVADAGGWLPGGATEAMASQVPLRLDRTTPSAALVDQHGARVSVEDFRGRPVLVTFAYGECHTICPVVVREALAARSRLAEADPVVLVVTLDPWRDTPRRLPHVAAGWGMGDGAHLLGGTVEEVEAALDAWSVPRGRDPRTGAVTHPPLTYVVDARGRIAFALTGGADEIVEAVGRL